VINSVVEGHPFEPFLPKGARLLMLGTFPPAEKRWSMKFYYPNFINDMWRIFGIIFFGNKDYFVNAEARTFRLDLLIPFLEEKGIALFDTCTKIRRTTGTASDKDLEVVEETDLHQMLRILPDCKAVVTAGQLATDIACHQFGIIAPKVGAYSTFQLDDRTLRLYRMPSSSRAYPMKAERKAESYQNVFDYLFF
jgi:G:T/U-mismatch repair DNA glycosylase